MLSASAGSPGEIGLGQERSRTLRRRSARTLRRDGCDLHHPRQLFQHEVAREVAVHVVDLLEVIEVEHQEAELARVARAAQDFALERLVEVPLVVRPA